jgi:soluble epoxide hydrolase/lipid-phosphate phosphatase
MPDLVGDLLCILEHAGVVKAIAVGYVTFSIYCFPEVLIRVTIVGFARHDWGTQLAYEAARERPDVFTAVVGITIPVIPFVGPVARFEG